MTKDEKITFAEGYIAPKAIRRNWVVFLTEGKEFKARMGTVDWDSKTRSYCFWPEYMCGYGPRCLEEIIPFLKNANMFEKERVKKQRAARRKIDASKR